MTAEYTRVPSSPPSNGTRSPRPTASPRRWALRIVLALFGAVVLHYAVLGFRAQHMAPRPHVPVVTEDSDGIFAELVTGPSDSPSPPVDSSDFEQVAEGEATEEEDRLSAETLQILGSLPRGAYVKDMYPIRTMRAFLELAELEIKRAGVDTCRDRLGVPLITEWAKTGKAACRAPERGTGTELRSSITPADSEVTGTQARQGRDLARRAISTRSEEERDPREQGSITCLNPKDGRGSSWWAMGSYPCLSTGLQTWGNASRFATPLDCTLPRSRDKYALANLLDDRSEVQCKEWVNTTTFLVHRRDEWNP